MEDIYKKNWGEVNYPPPPSQRPNRVNSGDEPRNAKY